MKYVESSGDIANDVRFKVAAIQLYLFDIFNLYPHDSKTKRDRDFIVDLKNGFGDMSNLLVPLPMMPDSKGQQAAFKMAD